MEIYRASSQGEKFRTQALNRENLLQSTTNYCGASLNHNLRSEKLQIQFSSN